MRSSAFLFNSYTGSATKSAVMYLITFTTRGTAHGKGTEREQEEDGLCTGRRQDEVGRDAKLQINVPKK